MLDALLKQQRGGDTTAALKTLQGPGLTVTTTDSNYSRTTDSHFSGEVGLGGSTSQITAGRGGGACVREKQECIP